MTTPKLLALLPVFSCLNYWCVAQNDFQVIGDAVFTHSEIVQGVEAYYLIRFQNFGPDTAYNVVVRDTLDSRFDANTFQVIDASHPYELLREQGNVRWFFDGIRLPSAEGGPGPETNNSTGYILFSVEPRRFLNPDQVIPNHACIVFDTAEPLCTNTASIWLDEDSNVADIENRDLELKIVPNPNYGHFSVQKNKISPSIEGETVAWWVSDLTGKTIWDGSSQDMASAPEDVYLEKAAPGLYLLWVKEDSRLQVAQFAVIR